MDILLVYLSGHPDRSDPYISLLPVGLCTLQSSLRENGHNAVIANYSGWSEQKILSHLKECKPVVIGISLWTHNRHASIALASLIKKILPETIVVAGGAHATFQYQHLLSAHASPFDAVVLGEGEETLLELVKCICSGRVWSQVSGIAVKSENTVVATPPRPYIQTLDSLPFASSYLDFSAGVDERLQAEFILTSRGCPSSCTFCSSPAFWSRKVRFRSPESIVQEISMIRNRYGLIYFSFRDDTFTIDRERTITFCKLLIEQRLGILWNCQSRVNALDEELLIWMKRAGCECIQLGVESGSPRILKVLGKKITPAQIEHAANLIHNAGINLSVYLISDIPGETEQDLQHTFSLIRNINPDDGYVSPLAYFPGTHLYEKDVNDGLISDELYNSVVEEALFVNKKSSNSQRLVKSLMRNRPKKNAQKFREQKKKMGFCYTTNILMGEWLRQHGNSRGAEAEFREICENEQDNPWGWYLLAELYQETKRNMEAEKCYERVCHLVPNHKPSLLALG